MPVSLSGKNWLGGRATQFDAISTLLIADLDDMYDDAHKHARLIGSAFPTHTFEYHIRVVGGLMGAHSLTGDPMWLQGAMAAADALLEGPMRPVNVLPLRRAPIAPSGSWLAWIVREYENWKGESSHFLNSVAGAGTFALEFEALSRESGDERYAKEAQRLFKSLARIAGGEEKATLIKWNGFDVRRPEISGSNDWGPVGSGSDSMYEYLFKASVAANATESSSWKWFKRVEPLIRKVALSNRHRLPNEPCVPGSACERRFTHLLSFLPGLLAQSEGSVTQETSLILEACLAQYADTATGLGPEEVWMDDKRGLIIHDPSYRLRPELLESLAIFRALDSKNQLAWQKRSVGIWRSLQRHCELSSGFAGLKDVGNASAGHIDWQPSYFIAETLKYLLLSLHKDADFGESLFRQFVFSTEGHPIRRKGFPLCMSTGSLCFEMAPKRLEMGLPFAQACLEWAIVIIPLALLAMIIKRLV